MPMNQTSSLMRKVRAHVLVVDDSVAMRKLMQTVLEEEGLSVELAPSVAAARQLLSQDGLRFDIVVSDINMPVETGFDLLKWIKSEQSPIPLMPVLLTTAELPQAEHRLHGLMLGAVDYVVRPVDLREFAVRVIHAIENHQRIRSLETALQDSQGLAMLGRLLAASNHEIKNLASIVTVTADQVARIVESRVPEPSPRETATVKALVESAGLLVDVARHITDLLEPGIPSHRNPINLSVLLPQVVAMMLHRIKPIHIEHESQENSAPIWALGHTLRIKQVLVNLILNAADAIHEFTPDSGGFIRVEWGYHESHTFVLVKDNGIGLSQAGVRAEFVAFATTKKLRGGQGLGLWLCSRLIENIGGRLTLESDGVGKGATARITLPRASDLDTSETELDLEQYFCDSQSFGCN